jgi:hypothetical protein
MAQMITVPNPSPNEFSQNPQAEQVQLPLPTVGIPGTMITPQTSNRLVGNVSLSGRALPGMPRGAPIKSPMGARDPTASYMRPPVIGPLFCDPSINIAC